MFKLGKLFSNEGLQAFLDYFSRSEGFAESFLAPL
jgi:hypothetical protein